MQIIKQKRNYWRVEPGNTSQPYATLEKTCDYDATGKWLGGWHVRLRDKNGRITGKGKCHKTANIAAVEAIELLTA